MAYVTRKRELILLAVNVIATTIAVGIAKQYSSIPISSFIAGLGVGGALVYVYATNTMLNQENRTTLIGLALILLLIIVLYTMLR